MYKVIYLDYGHGGMINNEYQTPGEKQYHFTQINGDVELSIYEGEVNREIAARLANMLMSARYLVYDVVQNKYLTTFVSAKDLEQRDISLGSRVRCANEQHRQTPGIYISLHANAIGNNLQGPSVAVDGAMVFTSRGQTASDLIATDVLNEIGTRTELRKRTQYDDGDSDYERDFYVLKKTNMPAILVEAGFYTNLKDATYISSTKGQDEIAAACFIGLSTWISKTVN